MGAIFHWFYCLPILEAVLLTILATVAFLILESLFGNKPYWRTVLSILFFCWVAIVFRGTLGHRIEGGNILAPILIPFASYYTALNGGSNEIYRTNFMNIVLFYPAGLFGCGLLPTQWRMFRKVLLLSSLFMLVSIGIEYTQYHFGMGLAETDDVIHNTLGTILGAIACSISIKLHKK